MSELKLIRTQVRVPSASVKALVATDYELVAAPGAGKVIVPHFAVVTLDFNTTAYAWANSDHGITIGEMAFDSDAEAQALIESADRMSVVLRPPAGSAAEAAENTALKLAASGTGEPATGDSDLIIDLQYSVHDVSEGV